MEGPDNYQFSMYTKACRIAGVQFRRDDRCLAGPMRDGVIFIRVASSPSGSKRVFLESPAG